MEPRGYVIIFGGLALVIALITGGIFVGHWLGAIMIALGVAAGVAWLAFMAEIIAAFNSDV